MTRLRAVTRILFAHRLKTKGLSPRERGHHHQGGVTPARQGTIPA